MMEFDWPEGLIEHIESCDEKFCKTFREYKEWAENTIRELEESHQ